MCHLYSREIVEHDMNKDVDIENPFPWQSVVPIINVSLEGCIENTAYECKKLKYNNYCKQIEKTK